MLYATDVYLSERSLPLSSNDCDILTYLYAPLLKTQAYSLYMYLNVESMRMRHFHQPCAISRLTMALNLDLEELDQARKTLEGLSLLKSYYKESEGQGVYIFHLMTPLSVNAFFRNQILAGLLQKTIGVEEYTKTKNYFRSGLEKLTEYEEVTSCFEDVFTIDLSQNKPLKHESGYQEEESERPIINYDLTLFYETLKDYQVPMKIVNRNEDTIKQIATLYAIDQLSLALMVKDAIMEGKFNRKALVEQAKRYYSADSASSLKDVYHTQPIQHASPQTDDDNLNKHFRYLETISPYQLLKNKQGGKEPALHDLNVAESLMAMGLTPAVTNMLIEYVLGRSNGRLDKNYCETIGASWVRKGLMTARDAYQEVHNTKTQKTIKKTTKKKENKPVEVSAQDQEELRRLMEGLGGDL